ncbi:MAG: hypothetical protein ABIF71_04540 [Planctomycetota bacterium]
MPVVMVETPAAVPVKEPVVPVSRFADVNNLPAPTLKAFTVNGLGGAGGMFCPTISAFDPNFMMIACDMSGAYYSYDGGKTWTIIQFTELSSSLSTHPCILKDEVLWVKGSELRRSTDRGKTWRPVVAGKQPWGEAVTRIAASPDGASIFIGTDKGLWASSDRGANWLKAGDGKCGGIVVLGDRVYVALDSNLLQGDLTGGAWTTVPVPNGTGITALAGGMAGETVALYATADGVGVIKSIDKGATWEVKTATFEKQNDIVMSPNQTDVAWTAQTGSGGLKIWRTADGGATWTGCFDMGTNVERSWVQTELSWGYYIVDLGLGADPANPNTAVMSTQGDFYITRDAGKSWQQLMNKPIGKQGDAPGYRYACTGLEVTSCWKYLFDPSDYNKQYIAYSDIGFGRTVDAGATWIHAAKGTPWGNTFYDVVFDPYTPGAMYAAGSNRHDIPHWTHVSGNTGNPHAIGGVVMSKDFAAHWEKIGTGYPNLPCTSICIDPATPAGNLTMYATFYEGGVYKSMDNGATWVNKSRGLGNEGNMHCYRVRRHPKDGSLYCLITAHRFNLEFPVPGGVWKSTDGAETWVDITKDQQWAWPTTLALHPADPNTIYVTTATTPKHKQGGLNKTTDGGKTWTQVLSDKMLFDGMGGSGYDHPMSIALHPENQEIVYCGTNAHGLWISLNGGKDWKPFKNVMFSNVQSITFDPKDPTTIVLTTFGGGVWRGPYVP